MLQFKTPKQKQETGSLEDIAKIVTQKLPVSPRKVVPLDTNSSEDEHSQKSDSFTVDLNFLIRRGNTLVTFEHKGVWYLVTYVTRIKPGEYMVTYLNFSNREVKVYHVGTEGFKIFPRCN